MNSKIDNPRMPEELARLASQPRVLVRRSGLPRKGGRCVVYWMQRAMRIVDNPALDVAIETGNLLGLPVVVFFFAQRVFLQGIVITGVEK
jgi:deoxyribodipyrimidine photo-lyase